MSAVRTPREKSIEFKEESNVLQVGDPSKNKARRLLRKAKDLTTNRSKTQGAKKRSKSILKNANNKNRNQE
jgi:hypothetical protein